MYAVNKMILEVASKQLHNAQEVKYKKPCYMTDLPDWFKTNILKPLHVNRVFLAECNVVCYDTECSPYVR